VAVREGEREIATAALQWQLPTHPRATPVGGGWRRSIPSTSNPPPGNVLYCFSIYEIANVIAADFALSLPGQHVIA